MFNRKSIYALNKKGPDTIVYMDANEVLMASHFRPIAPLRRRP